MIRKLTNVWGPQAGARVKERWLAPHLRPRTLFLYKF